MRSLRDFAFNKMCLMRCFYTKMNALGAFQRLVLCVFIPRTLQNFLMANTNIDNRLTYLVRDIIGQEYALLVMAVVAVFGIQLIEPFHAVTISKTSNHKSLQVFLQELYCKMLFPISEDFFKLETPWYPGISDELFDNVIKGYKTHVVQSGEICS